VDVTGITQDLHDDTVVRAGAAFSASAIARLARMLHDRGVIDDFLIGELAAVAADCGREAGTDAAVKAMEVIQADLGASSRRQDTRDAALDEAQDAEDAAGADDDADVGAEADVDSDIEHEAQVAARERAR
jgi:hypothetical protein